MRNVKTLIIPALAIAAASLASGCASTVATAEPQTATSIDRVSVNASPEARPAGTQPPNYAAGPVHMLQLDGQRVLLRRVPLDD